MLYFGFRTGKVLTHWWFNCCWVGLTLNQGLFRASCCPASEEAGGKRTWEGTQPGQLPLTGQRDISNPTASCWKTKLGWVGWPDIGQWVVRNYTVHHLCFMFFLPYYYVPLLFCLNQLSLSQPTSLTFFPRFSLPSLGRGREGLWGYSTTTWHSAVAPPSLTLKQPHSVNERCTQTEQSGAEQTTSH